MKPLSDELLFEVGARVFEQLSFLFVTADGVAAPPPAQTAASVRFDGPLSGRLVVTVDGGLPAALASNMLGLDAETTPTVFQQSDALKELANVICGNLLPEIAGTEVEFRVRPPVLLEPGAADGDDAPTAAATMSLDGGTARLTLHIFSEAWAAAGTSGASEAP
jgi:CheY-specific phosphatase CheX